MLKQCTLQISKFVPSCNIFKRLQDISRCGPDQLFSDYLRKTTYSFTPYQYHAVDINEPIRSYYIDMKSRHRNIAIFSGFLKFPFTLVRGIKHSALQ